jgi:coenzyme F420 hydrogenase subunit delta
MESEKFYLDMSKLVFGCGNVLFGDDGFGPSVVDYINDHYRLPEDTQALNVETSIRGLLFNLLISETKPKLILIIDAVDKGKKPGEVFEIDLDSIPENKLNDLSMHQMPSSNLLKELRDESSVVIRILVCQVEHIPPEVQPGLSQVVQDAIPVMVEEVIKVLDKFGVKVESKNL